MRVMLLEDDERFGLKKGDICTAEKYRYDPEKVSIIARESDGFDPECNQYIYNVAFWIQDQWQSVKEYGAPFTPIETN